MENLVFLASLIKERNKVAAEIAQIIGRPARVGHVGEYIASQIFHIDLQESASAKSLDGYFRAGQLKDCSVNIKWYGKREGLLDLTLNALPDYYLVLTGPQGNAESSRGQIRPWVIESVFLFHAQSLIQSLLRRNLKIGVATSIKKECWRDAEIYPVQRDNDLILSQEQWDWLAFFSA